MSYKLSLKPISCALKPAKLVLQPFDPIRVGSNVFGSIDISISPVNESIQISLQHIKTPGGRFAFYHLPDCSYSITVDTAYYISKSIILSFPNDASESANETIMDEEITLIKVGSILLVDMRLLPSPVYLFPAGSTVLRARVFKVVSTEIPIADAKIYAAFNYEAVEHSIYVSRTDSNGQAVIYCNRMTKNQILQINGFTFDGPRTFSLIAKDPISGNTATITIEIKEFLQTSVDIILPG